MSNLMLLLFGLGSGLVLGALLLGISLWVRSKPIPHQRDVGLLAANLEVLSENLIRIQRHMGEQLQAQERAVTKALDERLADVSRRVGDSLEKTSAAHTGTLTDLRERLTKIDEAQKVLSSLSGEVIGLKDILSNKQARGAFGEVQLKDLVTDILPPSAYDFQTTLSNGKRADCLIRLPNPPGAIAIDAKFPLESYAALQNATDDVARIAARRQLASDMAIHIKAIADRYILPGETAESALLFLPSEAIYLELHTNLQNVIEQSRRTRVFIVSPTTLWATLTTVRAVLRDARMREQAHVIQNETRLLLEDVRRLTERVTKLKNHFDQSNRDLQEIGISVDKITKRGERMTDLELGENPTITLEDRESLTLTGSVAPFHRDHLS
ncbi:MAG: DNA recombination protein RmuC [Alphaproteobacteria bacterium]